MNDGQLDLWDDEDPGYLSRQLITYLGNKRSLLSFLTPAVDAVRRRLGKEAIAVADLFSGSGVVSRYLKRYASALIANDIEPFAAVTNRCYLANRSEVRVNELQSIHAEIVDRLEREPLEPGIIAELYAPRDENAVQLGERAFYTPRNARFLDTARRLISDAPAEFRDYLLAPLLSEASIHANTSGVFKGFYKDRDTGIGRFGGTGGNALERILAPISLPFPVFSRYECDTRIYREDANTLVDTLPALDLAYIDPPYNQHPYGSNYFMLNLLVDYGRPTEISSVSGIPKDWQRSDYNKPRLALERFRQLVTKTPAAFLLISFNSEGFIAPSVMVDLLAKVGSVEVFETRYNTFRGSRNLRNRSAHVTEYLYLVEK